MIAGTYDVDDYDIFIMFEIAYKYRQIKRLSKYERYALQKVFERLSDGDKAEIARCFGTEFVDVVVSEQLNTLNEEIALKSIINQALSVFPNSFINHNNEIILEPRNNVYFRLDDVNTALEFKCKMFAWVSRPIAKGLNKYWSPRVLRSFNAVMGTIFTRDEMLLIYDRLGNDVNRKLTTRFIESNYDLSILDGR